MGTLYDVKGGDHKPAGQKQGWSPGVLPTQPLLKELRFHLPGGLSPSFWEDWFPGLRVHLTQIRHLARA